MIKKVYLCGMKLQTTIEIPQPKRLLGLRNHIAFIGSCFAEKIGMKMRQSGLPALVNPFGVLFNPLSILQMLTQNPMEDALYFADEDGRWHCWLADSSKNASSREACQAGILSARGRLFSWSPDTLVITLGTNRYYQRRPDRPTPKLSPEGGESSNLRGEFERSEALPYTGERGEGLPLVDCGEGLIVVGNCHKRPQTEFVERDLSVSEATEVLDRICSLFPQSQIILTVSPYRYAKYGFHESRLAKAVLLLAVDEVIRRRPEQVSYFPAYEIQLDELRDYRFFDADMLHPSPQAVDYIWERFADRWLDAETHRFLVDYEPIRKAMQHRPDDPDSPATIRFRERTQEQLNALMEKYHIEP